MVDLFTFGESMLRLSAPPDERLEDAAALHVHVGGAESNVASNLARLGKRVVWFSRLPDTPPGYTVRNAIRHHGVDTSHVLWVDDARQGLYFAEFAQAPRGIQVWYDRKESAASQICADDLPFDVIDQSAWLHLTGITAALSETCRDAARAAAQHVQNTATRLSFDVNYRSRLWTEEDASHTMTPLCQMADVVFVALRDAINLWGAPETAAGCSAALHDTWGGTVIVSDGENGVTATDAQGTVHVDGIETTVVDRIGAGDALASGVLFRLIDGAPLADALTFGVTLAGFALTIPGDVARVQLAEIEAYLSSGKARLTR